MLDPTALDIIEERWRPSFHLCPTRGLINDPNGLIFWKGAYHVFYQWNPEGCSHSNKHWAHVKSEDLIHWETLPIALAPDASFDVHGCYSGSALDLGDSLLLLYTGNVRDEAGGRLSNHCLARSSDGVRFEKLGPVIEGSPPAYTSHFRDPKAWRHDDTWYAVLGAQRAADLKGTIVLAKSDDLRAWHVVGELLAPADSCYMIECPDLFELGGRTVLVCCRQIEVTCGDESGRDDIAGYWAGDVDLDAAAYEHGEFRRLDHGFDFYAPQTLAAPDGRRLMIGWMGMPSQPDTPTVAAGWTHCLTMPRELSLENGRLLQRPLRELERLRGPAIRLSDARLTADASIALPTTQSSEWELQVSIDAVEGANWALYLFEANTQSLRLIYDDGAKRLALIRHCPATGQFHERRDCGMETSVTRLRIFVDRSCVEIFVNGGEAVFTTRFYPGPDVKPVRFVATGPATLRDICWWPLRKDQ